MIEIKFEFDEKAMKMLADLPMQIHFHAIDKCMPAMAKPIIAKAKEIAPRSEVTKTRDKWGPNKTYGKDGKVNFDPETWKRDTSADHMGYRVRKKGLDGSYIKIGTRSPRGNKSRFNQTRYTKRRVFFWGKNMNMTYEPPYRFMQRAYDETIPAQISAFNAALETFKLP